MRNSLIAAIVLASGVVLAGMGANPQSAPPASSYLSYATRSAAGAVPFAPVRGVQLTDPFESLRVSLVRESHIYVASTVGADVQEDDDPALRGYKIRPSKTCGPSGEVCERSRECRPETVCRDWAKRLRRPGNLVTDRFGTWTLDLVKPTRLLVPATLDTSSPPPPLGASASRPDEYKCYLVRVPKGTATPRGMRVAASDRLTDSKTFEITAFRQLCLAVDRDGGGVIDPTAALSCYQITTPKDQAKHVPRTGLWTNDPFGLRESDTAGEAMLCVPSFVVYGPTPSTRATPTPTPGVTPTGTPVPTLTATATPDPSLPPDPSEVAPAVAPGAATTLGDSTSFLYSGLDPIQTGVAVHAIDRARVSVLRGRVLVSASAPLGGVTIRVKDHPEFGETVTRADGMFDLAVNGGSSFVVEYEKSGFISAQRRSGDAAANTFVWVDDVHLIPYDARVTTIDLDAPDPMQVVRGSAIEDGDGRRRATLLIPKGTRAFLQMPDGAEREVDELSIRATEYTIGADGPTRMPMPLPPSSGYTYAVEYSVDEAIAEGASNVRFGNSIVSYLENFLAFPVGMPVPTGYYDRARAEWVPSADGRVVKILGVASGLATLDINGSGTPASAFALESLGITSDERASLAGLYAIGTVLWRVPVDHFTPIDKNWPRRPPADAVPPSGFARPRAKASPVDSDDDEEFCGSIIEASNQVLREDIPIAGTPFALHYSSDRMQGFDSRTIRIPLSGATIPTSLTRIELEVFVAGQRHRRSFPAAANLVAPFTWDGRDAYGRVLQGAQTALVRIGWVYPVEYAVPSATPPAFARFSATAITDNQSREELTLYTDTEVSIGRWSLSAIDPALGPGGVGGWTLSPHHLFDPQTRTLFEGGGTRRSVAPVGLDAGASGVIETIAGTGTAGLSGDDGPATQAQLRSPSALAIDPAGNLFVLDGGNSRVRRIDAATGEITTVAGGGDDFCGEGGRGALALSIGTGSDIAVDAVGTLWISDTSVFCDAVYRIDPSGRVTRYTQPGQPKGLAIDVLGNAVVGDSIASMVRRIDRATGVFTTMAGAGNGMNLLDGNLATSGAVRTPQDFAFDARQNLLIVERPCDRIRRVDAVSGLISTFAGPAPGPSGTCTSLGAPGGDGGPAKEAGFGVIGGVAIDRGGNVFVADESDMAVRRIDGQTGIITTFAGSRDRFGPVGDGGPPASARLLAPTKVVIDAQGTIFIADASDHRVRRIRGSGNRSLGVASEDGSLFYEFDEQSRHIKTRYALTGAELLSFQTDAARRLTAIVDADGKRTTIERDENGRPTAIVAPFGQRTALAVDPNGYLSSVTNPAGETVRLGYAADGLLTSFANGRNFTSVMDYDDSGRLTSDTDAVAGAQMLAVTEDADGRTVRHETALGRASDFRTQTLATGDRRQETERPDGTELVRIARIDGSEETTSPTGVTVSRVESGDPRFAMSAPIAAKTVVRMPSGVTLEREASRSVALSDAADPLSVTQLSETMDVNGAVAQRTYTAANRTITETSPAGRKTYTTIDERGRIVSTQVDGLLPVTVAYDAATGGPATITQGNGASARTVAFAYGPTGNLESVGDPIGRTVAYQYDLAGRLIEQKLPGERAVRFASDPNGNVTSITPPGRPAHRFTYSPLDQLATYSPPDVGQGGAGLGFAYDADRKPTMVTRPDGKQIEFSYDTAGRVIGQSSENADVTYAYEATTGRLSSIATSSGEGLTYAYDGDLVTSVTWSGTVSGTVARTYDRSFRTASISVNGSAVEHVYDADGLLIKVQGPDGNANSSDDLTITRDPQKGGLVTATKLGNVTDARSYNEFGELMSYAAKFGATNLFSTSFLRDALGRIVEKTETVGGVTTTFEYAYDDAGRLAAVRKNSGIEASYEYDSNGNRLTGPGLTSAAYDDRDQLLAADEISFSYGANGELSKTSAGAAVTSYEYDVAGNLTSVSLSNGKTIGYVHDADGRRVARTVDGAITQRFLYQDGLKPAAEVDANGQVLKRFVFAEYVNAPSVVVQGGVAFRVIADHLGSPRLVVNATTGTIVQRLDFDEFGRRTGETNPSAQPFGFAGGLSDVDTELVLFGSRSYDPARGRWITVDRALFAGGAANLYEYAANDPVNLVDPAGFAADVATYADREDDAFTQGLDALGDTGFLFGRSIVRGLLAAGGGIVAFRVAPRIGLKGVVRQAILELMESVVPFELFNPYGGEYLEALGRERRPLRRLTSAGARRLQGAIAKDVQLELFERLVEKSFDCFQGGLADYLQAGERIGDAVRAFRRALRSRASLDP